MWRGAFFLASFSFCFMFFSSEVRTFLLSSPPIFLFLLPFLFALTSLFFIRRSLVAAPSFLIWLYCSLALPFFSMSFPQREKKQPALCCSGPLLLPSFVFRMTSDCLHRHREPVRGSLLLGRGVLLFSFIIFMSQAAHSQTETW